MNIEFFPIGIIHSPCTGPAGAPIQGVYAPDAAGTVEVYPQFSAGLADLEGFSHIILLYCFHLSRGCDLRCRPFLDVRDRGVFATRAPRRPNPIGMSVVRLLGIEGRQLTIGGVDILDGAPLLDIKPYVPDFDAPRHVTTGWLETAGNTGRTVADDRFVEKKKN